MPTFFEITAHTATEIEDESAYCSLASETSLYTVEGRDAARYLNGRLTQNIKSLALLGVTKSLLLNPRGKIQAALSVIRSSENGYLLMTHGAGLQDFEHDLLQFKVADNLTCTQVHPVAVFFLNEKQSAINSSAIAQCNPENYISFPFPLADGRGAITICQNESTAQTVTAHKKKYTPSLFHYARIVSSTPWHPYDLSEKVTATEIPYHEYISFSKGCYAGQEVVEMSIARGRPNYQLVQIEGSLPTAPSPQSPLTHGTDASVCGHVTYAAYNSNTAQFRALAFLRTAILPVAEVQLAGTPCRVMGV